MRIPMRGAIGSLNAAVAGSILLFEAVAQRDPGSRAEAKAVPAQASPTTGTTPAGETATDAPPNARKVRKATPKPTEAAAKPPKSSKARTVATAPEAPTEEPDSDLLPGGPAAPDTPEPDEPPTA
jgi:hypothetical protein